MNSKILLNLHVFFFNSRYGLPVNFIAILIHPNKKSMKRLRDTLQQLYGHLDGSSAAGSASDVSVLHLHFFVWPYFIFSSPECWYSWSWFRTIRIFPVRILQTKYWYDWQQICNVSTLNYFPTPILIVTDATLRAS